MSRSVRLFLSSSLLVAVLSFPARSQPAEAPSAEDTVGVPWTGPIGVRERTADIMTRQAAQAQKTRPYRVHIHHEEGEFVEYAEENVATSPPSEPGPPIPASAVNAQGVAFSFTGATLGD